MKKTLLVLLLTFVSSAMSFADDIAEGYYRVVNIGLETLGDYFYNKTTAYCRVCDDTIPVSTTAGTSQNFEALQMWPGKEAAIASPASVIYVKKISTGWDLLAQGISVEECIKANTSIKNIAWNVTGSADNCTLYASASGMTLYLWSTLVLSRDSYFTATTASTVTRNYQEVDKSMLYKTWKLIKIDNDDNYVAVKPRLTVEKDGVTKYYAPYYASFPFRVLSTGMKVFYVSDLGEDYYTLKQIESDIIPAATPVLIECASENIQDNKIEPLYGVTTPTIKDNKLSGCYFCNDDINTQHARTTFNTETMRAWNIKDGKLVLSNDASGYTTLRAGSGYCMKANESYATNLPAGTEAILYEGTAKPKITSISVDKQTVTIPYTETATATVSVIDASAGYGSTVTATTSNPSVATVTASAVADESGKAMFTITPVTTKGGTAIITYSILSSAGKTLTTTTDVTIPATTLSALTTDNDSLTVSYAMTGKVTVTASPAYALNGESVTATSSDEAVAALTSNTLVFDDAGQATFTIEGKYPGKATIVFSVPGTTLTARTVITVAKPYISEFSVSDPSATIEKYQSKTITVTALPLAVSKGRKVHAETSDASVVSVSDDNTIGDDGSTTFVITGKNEGAAVITYTISDGYDTYTTKTSVKVPFYQPDTLMISKSHMNVVYLESGTVTVSALPVINFAGKTITATFSQDGIVKLRNTSFTLSDNAEATIEIISNDQKRFGQTVITFSVEGSTLSVRDTVTIPAITVPMPTSDLPDGTVFYKGKAVSLSTSSSDHTLYYTTDGSDPRTSPTRMIYTVPLVLDSTVNIKAIAEDGKLVQSDVLNLTYALAQNLTGIPLATGWNWVSFYITNDYLKTYDALLSLGTWGEGDEVKDKSSFYDYSVKYGKWYGTLKKSSSIDKNQIDGMLKIHSWKTQKLGVTGKAINPDDIAINVTPGWNYIAYIPVFALDVNDAMSDYPAKVNDIIKSQDAVAIYNGTGWTGSLTTLQPGSGYMLMHCDSSTTIAYHYPVIYPTSTSEAHSSGLSSFSAAEETNGDIHLFSGNMTLVATLSGNAEEGDIVVATANGEVRGKAEVTGDKKIVMSIEGDAATNVTLTLERNGVAVATASETMTFQDDAIVGTWTAPTSVTFITADDTTDPPSSANEIYDLNGKAYGTYSKGKADALPDGTYIIKTDSNTSKVLKR